MSAIEPDMTEPDAPEADCIQCMGFRCGHVVILLKDGDVKLGEASLDFAGALGLAAELTELVARLKQLGALDEPVAGHA